jgi:hypothetical protein
MADQQTPKETTSNDEIDLGQLFNMIGKGFTNLFNSFLRFFLYIKRNIIKFAILTVVGLLLGYGLNQIIVKKQKIEVIVKPNLESKNYLYDVVDEIGSNIKAKDTVFFSKLGIDVRRLKGFNIEIQPIEKESVKNTDEDIKYLELLEKFRNDPLIADVVRTEIFNKSILNHRITFTFKNSEIGIDYARKLVAYINSNDYYTGLVKITTENAEKRIEQNQNLVQQIDELIANYSVKMVQDSEKTEGRIFLDNEGQLDITGILNLKNRLIRDSELKKLEIQGQKEAISIINFGRAQLDQKSFFNKSIIFTSFILIGLFILIDIIKYLNKRANKMELN